MKDQIEIALQLKELEEARWRRAIRRAEQRHGDGTCAGCSHSIANSGTCSSRVCIGFVPIQAQALRRAQRRAKG